MDADAGEQAARSSLPSVFSQPAQEFRQTACPDGLVHGPFARATVNNVSGLRLYHAASRPEPARRGRRSRALDLDGRIDTAAALEDKVYLRPVFRPIEIGRAIGCCGF